MTILRHVVAGTMLFAATFAHAAPKDLVGKPLEDLISCAGLPRGQMEVGNTTFLQYGASRQVGTFQQFGNIGTFQRHETGCEATIAVRDGVVVDVKTRPFGGLLTGPMACNRLFKACR